MVDGARCLRERDSRTYVGRCGRRVTDACFVVRAAAGEQPARRHQAAGKAGEGRRERDGPSKEDEKRAQIERGSWRPPQLDSARH